jgi:hypothetical protein
MRYSQIVCHGARLNRFVEGKSELRIAAALLSMIVCLVVPKLAYGDVGGSNVSLRVVEQGNMAKYWRARKAMLTEDFTGTTGRLEVENKSGTSLDNTIFYGEYFDSAGRLCFTLAFSAEKDAKKGPVNPGEVRTFYAIDGELFAASRPQEVRVYLVQQSIAGQENSLHKWKAPLRAPVTINAPSFAIGESNVQLSSEVNPANTEVVDLILAKVTVDQSGLASEVDILNSVSGPMESWFRDFVQRRKLSAFYPATENGAPKSDYALVVVRAFLIDISKEKVQSMPLPPRASLPWLRSYVTHLADNQLPPVTEVFFQRPPTNVIPLGKGVANSVERPAFPLGVVRLMYLGADWSLPTSDWLFDPSMPQQQRRVMKIPASH